MATKDAVLQALQNSEGAFLSGEELSNKLSVSRTTVWKAIKALREEGHPIEAVTNRGYMLMSDSWTITEDSLRACLPTRYKNLDLHIYDKCLFVPIAGKVHNFRRSLPLRRT